MYKKFIAPVLLLSVCCTNIAAETVTLTSGSLPTLVKSWADSNPTELILTGEATAIDMTSLKNLPSSVESLDMSALSVKGITLNNSSYLGQSEFADGELPPYSLFCTNVKNIRLPDSLSIIGEAAFAHTPVTEIEIPASVSTIGPRAFYLCDSLGSVDMSSTSLTTIPEQCFYGCTNLKAGDFPLTITNVENRAFMKSGLTSIYLPNALYISEYAFAEIPTLADVTVHNDASFAEGAFFGDGVLTNINTHGIDSNSLALANSGSFGLSTTVSGQIVEEGAYANLKSDTVIILPSVKEIKSHAFRNAANLKTVDVSELGQNVPLLAEDAFSGVDVSTVKLATSDSDVSVWKAAPVWQNFNIGDEATKVISPDAVRINIVRNGRSVEITCNEAIDHVTIWSLSGLTLLNCSPETNFCSAGPFDDTQLLVRVIAGGITKLMKII